MNERYVDMTWGFGVIVDETDEYIAVRFDADPWGIHYFPKDGSK